MAQETITVGSFTFAIGKDITGDPLCTIEVWVNFLGEPCCDDNGHQYRFYLPMGIKPETLEDICQAFTKAVHCEAFSMAA